MKSKRNKQVTAPAQQPQTATPAGKVHPAMAAALARGEVAKKKMAASDGGAISCTEVSRLLGITQAEVMRRWQGHRLVGWPEGEVVQFPVWQFRGGRMLAGIEEVLQIFRSDDYWRIMLYFVGQRRSLNRQRALDLLRRGETERVITHARNYMIENEW